MLSCEKVEKEFKNLELFCIKSISKIYCKKLNALEYRFSIGQRFARCLGESPLKF